MKLFSLSFFFLLPYLALTQNTDGLVARYYFNEGVAKNDLTTLPVKAPGTVFDEDRFGNASSSLYLNGNINSYLNLGTSETLKPTTGSISIWVNIAKPIHAGKGYEANPIILTKCCIGNDYFEAYAIIYEMRTDQMAACSTLDSISQIIVVSPQPFQLREWHHLVMTYDDKEIAFYIDSKLVGRVNKNFRLKFLAGDSVMVGNSANSKNSRYLMGNVDDISIYNKVLTPADVLRLYKEADPNRLHKIIRIILFSVLGIAIISIMLFLLVNRFKRELEKEKTKNKLQSQMYEMEMKVIKAQMNPHFIFNSMNSIQQLMLSENIEKANVYLVKFSRLLRKILESNNEEYISVDNEIDILDKYIEIESLRFNQAFTYEIIVDKQLSGSHIRIPQMLIQPFVENAIWHGLLPKKGSRKLVITFECINAVLLSCSIDDNGVGYGMTANSETITKNKSLGIRFIKQRLELMKKISGGDYSLTITDKTDADGIPHGTNINIVMPIYTD